MSKSFFGNIFNPQGIKICTPARTGEDQWKYARENIQMVWVDKFVGHERTDYYLLEKKRLKFGLNGVIQKPIHSSPFWKGFESKLLILDGHHKREVLPENHEIRFLPSFLYDYRDLKMGAWFVSIKRKTHDTAVKMGVDILECDFEKGRRLVEEDKAFFMTMKKNGSRIRYRVFMANSGEQVSLGIIEEKQSELLRKLPENIHREIEYIPDEETFYGGCIERGDTVLYRRALKYDEVLKRVRRGELFAPKATRFSGYSPIPKPIEIKFIVELQMYPIEVAEAKMKDYFRK